MKQKGGVPPVFRKEPPRIKGALALSGPELSRAYVRGEHFVPPTPPQPQPIKTGLSQFFKRPRSPFTGPGPSTAGRKKLKRNRTRKMRR
jgi:hypothetical protein